MFCFVTFPYRKSENSVPKEYIYGPSWFPHDSVKIWSGTVCHFFGYDLLQTDKVDKILDCLRLQWHPTEGEQANKSSTSEFGIVPTEIMRGLI